MRTQVTRVVTKLMTSLILVASCCSCAANPQDELRSRPGDPQAISLQEAINETMAEARQAVNELGVTDAAVHHHFGSRQGLVDALEDLDDVQNVFTHVEISDEVLASLS